MQLHYTYLLELQLEMWSWTDRRQSPIPKI